MAIKLKTKLSRSKGEPMTTKALLVAVGKLIDYIKMQKPKKKKPICAYMSMCEFLQNCIRLSALKDLFADAYAANT